MGYENSIQTAPANNPLTVDYDEFGGLRKYLNPPFGFKLEDEIRKATFTVKNIKKSRISSWDQSFNTEMLRGADGLAFLTTVRAGAWVSAQFGSGLVIAKLPDGSWSAPCAIASFGTGMGLQVGVDVADMVMVLKNSDAVNAFKGNHQVALGGSMGVSYGPVGRHAVGELCLGTTQKLAMTWAYASSKGWFIGGSIDGTYIHISGDTNNRFYGVAVDSEDLLSGKVPRPKAAQPLYDALDEVLR